MLRAAHPDVHGIASVDVAIDTASIIVSMSSPLDNLIGFEHPPRMDGERCAENAGIAALRQRDKIFAIDALAGRTLKSVDLSSATPSFGRPGSKGGDLMPAEWDRMNGIRTGQLATPGDGDPPSMEAMDKEHVVIAGFAVPLDAEGRSVHELLLVPHFGACIHTPLPPANRVIHVILPKPAGGMRMMDTVRVTGTLRVATADTSMGPSGHQVDGESDAPFHGGTHP